LLHADSVTQFLLPAHSAFPYCVLPCSIDHLQRLVYAVVKW